MIDIILLFFVIGVFYAGFWCGKTYGSIKATWTALTTYLSSLF